MAIIKWLAAHEKPALHVILVLLVLAGLCFAWQRFHPAQPAMFESQQQAATPAGVQQAADDAQIPLSVSQVTRVAQSIQKAVNEPLAASVVTTGAKMKETVAAELKKSGGQVAIVTDPAHPAATPVVASDKTAPAAGTVVIPPTATVTLNQYNIKAYPDRLIQVGGSYQEVFAAYSWRVTIPKVPLLAPHGATGYLGAYAHANLDAPANSRAGVLLTIPQ